jgi:hypothetical protein
MSPKGIDPCILLSFPLSLAFAFGPTRSIGFTLLSWFLASLEKSVEPIHHLTMLLVGLESKRVKSNSILRTASSRHIWSRLFSCCSAAIDY